MRQGIARRVLSLALLAGILVGGTAAGASTRDRPASAPLFQKGINVFIGYNCTALSTWELWGTKLFSQIKALGANSVALDFPFYTDGHTADTYYAKQVCNTSFNTPSVSYVAALVDIAHSDGLQVFLRQNLDGAVFMQENPAYWAGNIAPAIPADWFNNYLHTLRPYLVMAQKHGVEHFSMSTELSSMETSSRWKSAISATRSLYRHDLVFTDVWRNNPNKGFWAGTTAGLDTYPYLPKLKVRSTVAQVLAAWNAQLKIDQVSSLSKWTDDETGILAQDGAYAYPNITTLSMAKHPFNQAIQSNWFSAACSFVKAHKMGGIYFTGVPIYDGALLTTPDTAHPFIIQPAGLAEIKKCFKTN